MTAARRRSVNGFRHPWAFWLGVAGVTGGVALHVPMFLGAKDDHYMLSGMPWDRWMVVGMAVMLAGYALILYGLSPRFSRGAARQASELEFEGLDEGKLTAAHVKLMVVLTLGVAIDTQKPFTFTFILPGVANEYNLRSPAHPAPGHWPVALFPFVAIVGTVLGSLLWGLLGDSIGRRAAILLASTLFIGTAMCSAMPAFHWNLVACFFMGLSAGGLLPIVYALLAETIPKRRRGEAIVLVAGIGTALGFLLASWTAHWLIPEFGWRIMWFFGVPTGLALILLNRFIPESPRFLLANGHADEAHEVMRSFGVTVTDRRAADAAPAESSGARPGIAGVFRHPYQAITPVLILYGLAWGLVNFGVLVWLPTYAAKSGVSAGQVTTILAKAALFAVPGSVVVAWLYGRWSSRGTLVLAAALEAAALGAFAVAGSTIVGNPTLFTAALVVLLVSMWATISALAPYSSEVYRTAIRGAGTGVVAGATKLGGVLALAIAVAAWAPPSLAGAALLAAVPAGLAAVLLLFVGVETRGRSLEDITEAEVGADARPPRQRALRIRGASYPVILPSSWKDPRLLLSTTFLCLHTLGQVEFHFALSIPQIFAALLSCGLLEAAIAFHKKRVLLWPASALLTGNGIAFILRVPGTQHGDWWSFHGVWIYVAVGVVSILSKYLIQFRGRHVFNPSNLGLVLCFLILGSSRVEPLQFWWGPMSPALVIVLGVIVVGAFVILSRVGLLAVAALFWVTFAAGLGILTLSGHAFSANWHLGPVADGYFWRVLITSPEVFIFLSFMITDPQTAPASRTGRRIYAIGIGLLSVLLIAPQTTEFAAKVALLGTLTIVCAARPLILLAREAIARRRATGAAQADGSPLVRRPAFRAAGAMLGAACFAGLVVVAGSPARSADRPLGRIDVERRLGQHRVDAGAREDRPRDREPHCRQRDRRPPPRRAGTARAQRREPVEMRGRELPRRPADADRQERRAVDHGAELPGAPGEPEAAARGRPGAADGRRHPDRLRDAAHVRTRFRDGAEQRDAALHPCLRSLTEQRPLPDHRQRHRGPARRGKRIGLLEREQLEGVRQLPEGASDRRRVEGRPELPPGRLPLFVGVRPAGDDGRRRLRARLQQRRLDRSLRRQLLRRRRPTDLGRTRGAAAERVVREPARQVHERQQGVPGRHPGQGHRLCRSRSQR